MSLYRNLTVEQLWSVVHHHWPSGECKGNRNTCSAAEICVKVTVKSPAALGRFSLTCVSSEHQHCPCGASADLHFCFIVLYFQYLNIY